MTSFQMTSSFQNASPLLGIAVILAMVAVATSVIVALAVAAGNRFLEPDAAPGLEPFHVTPLRRTKRGQLVQLKFALTAHMKVDVMFLTDGGREPTELPIRFDVAREMLLTLADCYGKQDARFDAIRTLCKFCTTLRDRRAATSDDLSALLADSLDFVASNYRYRDRLIKGLAAIEMVNEVPTLVVNFVRDGSL